MKYLLPAMLALLLSGCDTIDDPIVFDEPVTPNETIPIVNPEPVVVPEPTVSTPTPVVIVTPEPVPTPQPVVIPDLPTTPTPVTTPAPTFIPTPSDQIVVTDTSISWPDNGWYQVQDANTYQSLCEGGLSCAVSPGTYRLINLTTGQRFANITIDSPQVVTPVSTPTTTSTATTTPTPVVVIEDSPEPVVTVPSVLPDPVTPEPTALIEGFCQVTGSTFANTSDTYFLTCKDPLRDCDPDPDTGTWMCSSTTLGESDPTIYAESVAQQQTPPVVISNPSTDTVTPSTPETEEPQTPTEPEAEPEPEAEVEVEEPTEEADPITPPVVVVPDPIVDPNVGEFMTQLPGTYSGRYTPQGLTWADSYSIGDTCYIWSSFDHGIGDIVLNIDEVTQSVNDWAAAIKTGPGIDDESVDAIYNDIRCGRGPANDFGDEDAFPAGCPGRVDIGQVGCGIQGPDWSLE